LEYYLLQDNSHEQPLISWLLSNNVLNTVVSPMRVTNNSSSLTDVINIDKIFHNSTTEILELGYPDHFAKVLNVVFEKPKVGRMRIIKKCSKKENTNI
jgi:hypothetical protein